MDRVLILGLLLSMWQLALDLLVLSLNVPYFKLITASLLGRVKEPIFLELRTLASLPTVATKVAKLGPTSANHVVAAEVELDEGMASRASLPALSFGEGMKPYCGNIYGAIFTFVGCLFAFRTRCCPTTRANNTPSTAGRP